MTDRTPTQKSLMKLNKELHVSIADLERQKVQFDLQIRELEQALADARQSEEAFRQQEKRYRDVIENLEDGYCEVNLKGVITQYNDALQRIMGYSRQEMLSMDNRAYTTPDTSKMIFREVSEMYRTGNPLKMKHYEIIRKDGFLCTVELSASVMRDEAGRPVGFMSIVRDVSGRIEFETSLKESEERFRALFERSLDGIYICDFKGQLIDANQVVLDALKCGKQDIGSINVNSFLMPDQMETADKMLNELEKRGYQSSPTELKLRMGDGRQIIAEAKEYIIFRSGKPYAILGIIRDVTERKNREDALRLAEKRYRSIFENAQEGIFQSTQEGRYLAINAAFATMLGYDSPEALMTSVVEIGRQIYVNSQERSRLMERLDREKQIHKHETQFYRKDGERIWVSLNIQRIYDEDENFVYYEGICEDITSRKKADEEREKLKKQLFQAQKLEAIGTLASGIAHDFNNILASIMGYTELALKEVPKEKGKKYLEQVLRSCDRARDLIQRILTFSREQEQERRPVDLRTIVKESLKMLRSSLPTTIQIEQRIAPESATVLADPTQIHQIVMNLCTNAAQAMRDKGGVLTVHLANVEIGEEMQSMNPDFKRGPYVKLTVGDTGKGIDPSIQDMIFDPFFTTKKQEEGTGLGLSVVYGIVKNYDGVIDVKSEVGKGSVFVVYLPHTVDETPVVKAVPTENIQAGTGRILIVDDEEMLLLINETFLGSLGYDVDSATSGMAAWRKFEEAPERFDLVITDMTMPHMTGMELSQRILAVRPDIPIILCTGYNESILEEDAKKQGIRAFFMKPISLNALAGIVQQLLDRSGDFV